MHSAYDNSGKQFAWDSTSLSRFFTCPRLYYYSNILGWAPNKRSIHLSFGILAHSAREHYDHAVAKGAEHELALRETVRWLLVASKELPDDDSYKNRSTLLRTMVWYFETYKNDTLKTVYLANGLPAVELSFRFELDSSTILCGHIDKLVTHNDQVWVSDLKTAKAALNSMYFDQYSPSIQMPLYTLAGRVVYNTPSRGVIIDAAQIQVNGTRFARAPLPYSEAWLDEFLITIRHGIKLAEAYHKENFWPMNNTACHKFGGCDFRKVCSRSPDVREFFLSADFHKDRWDPLVVRGEAE